MTKPKIIQFKLKFLSKPTLLMLLLGSSAMGNLYANSSEAINVSLNKAELKTIQQSIKVTGKIVSASDKMGISGVNVTVKGVAGGRVSTDFDGTYTIEVPSSDAVLVFTYTGFKTQEIKVGSQKVINVSLVEELSTLNEVVVVAYGAQKKAVLTGAVEVVSSKAFQDRAVTNVGLALQGQTPGLVVSRSSSRPGNESVKFQIRGATSVNGGDPLVVIDGVPALNSYSFLNMNPDDIESVNVLKDASAGIYGSRAANGVILVTSKKGKGGMKIDYSGNIRFTAPGITSYSGNQKDYASIWLAANKEEATPNWWGWISQANMEKMATGYEGIYPTQYWGDLFIGKGNRIDEMFQPRTSYQHNFSISNKTDLMGYRLSLAFADNQGNLATAYDGQKQYNLRFNYDYQLSKRVKLETGISFINANTSAPSVGLDETLYANDMPFFPAKNPYGQWNANFGNVGNRNAAAATADGGRFDKKSLTSRFDAKAIVNIIEGLNFEAVASFQKEDYSEERYITPVQLYDWYGNTSKENLTSTIQSANNPGYKSGTFNSFYQYYSGLFKYNKIVNKLHNFSFTTGINAELYKQNTLSANRAFFTDLGVYDLNAADVAILGNSGGKDQTGQYSYITRLGYNYNEKYIAEITSRADGSSKFATGYKFKNFGSGLLGWVFSKEKFMQGISPVLNFGKIRASYGVSGNNVGIGNFDYASLVNNSSAVLGLPASVQNASYLSNNGLVSLEREWERVYQKNIGIDLAFLDNKLSTTFDYFIKDNKGMLVNKAYPSVLGGTAPKTNSGELNVKGWETVITWRDHKNDFSYNVSFNIGDNRTLLKHMEGADSYVAGRNDATIVQNGKILNPQVNGYPLNSFFLYQTNGYFKDQAEVDAYYAAYTAGGGSMVKVANGSASGLRPGDTKRIDLNGDGSISPDGSKTSDLKYMGDGDRHYSFGLNLGAAYKGIDFNALFQGVGEQQIMRSGYLAYPFATIYTNQPTNFEGKTWTTENPNAQYPRLTVNQDRANWNYQNNDFMLVNNAYIRLKALVVGYTLPKSITQKAYFERVRFYFSGDDLWELAKVKDGYDPEMGETSQNAGYPYYRTLSVGVNLGF